ncbi:MAG: ROK family protein [Actinobacteria bacterium]|nr:ROK family protein [Actinomycetota bacterium]
MMVNTDHDTLQHAPWFGRRKRSLPAFISCRSVNALAVTVAQGTPHWEVGGALCVWVSTNVAIVCRYCDGAVGTGRSNATVEVALAIELGGTKNSVGLVNRDGKVVDSGVLDPPEALDGLWEQIEVYLEQVPDRVTQVGGSLTACGVSVGPAVEELAGGSTRDVLAEAGLIVAESVDVPVFVDTAGRAFALAEGWVGSARGSEHFAALNIDDSVTGGVVLDGRLLDGGLSHAGRVGHVIVEPEGRRCACGARGCLEAEVSVGAIESSTGRPLTEPSYEHMQYVGLLVGRAAASIANLLDLRLIVCGGRVAREYASTMFLAAQAELDASCRLAFSRGTVIVSAKAPQPAGIVGAAAVGWRGFGEGV